MQDRSTNDVPLRFKKLFQNETCIVAAMKIQLLEKFHAQRMMKKKW